MPALSPTMTEGNIATWKVKEGDSFSAGDVLLEIETDKATMDVEAQDDGIVMKIMQGDGSKAVQVGTRIAVIAESGDDISSLELPADEQNSAPPTKEASKSDPAPPTASQSSQSTEIKKAPATKAGGKPQKQKYPLLPSVMHLVKSHGLDEASVNQITPSGPNGRLLKGDVLAYLGSINSEIPAQISERFDKLSHLDLSNIKVAEKKAAPVAKQEAPAPAAIIREDVEVSVLVSLAKVVEVQKKIQSTLGVFMPLSTFLARATEVANDDLPPSSQPPSANELFDQVLGLDKLRPRGYRGFYLPQITALPQPPIFASHSAPQRKPDIIDVLAGPSKKPASRPAPTLPGVSASGSNIFSVTVSRAEEERAAVFLERVKIILEEEPGRLVL
jgi:pyruvate/2-oxoglutarate dehydrogenase complex dihydrolipoamide acyltransferase (E2) component